MRTLKVILFIYLSNFSHWVWSGGLERLFTTAQERFILNKLRIEGPSPSNQSTPKEKVPPPPALLPEEIVFNGLVIRNQGASTVWINGSEELFRTSFKVILEKREGVSVPIILSQQGDKNQEEKEIWLKPGETMRTVEGKVLESYEPRSSIPKPNK